MHRYEFQDDLAKRLSAALNTSAIWIGYEDVSGSWDYTLFESGGLREVFHVHDPAHFQALDASEMRRLDERGLVKCSPPIRHGYFAGAEGRLARAEFEKLSGLKGRRYGEHLDGLFDSFLRRHDAYAGFNTLGEVGTEFYPLDEAADEEIERIDLVEA